MGRIVVTEFVTLDDAGAMQQASRDALSRRQAATERGVNFGETSFREIVFTDLR